MAQLALRRAGCECGEHRLRRVGDDGKKRARGSARHALACSQLRMVSTGTPSRAANSIWVNRARRRRSRAVGAVAASAGATAGSAGASGNSRPSRNSTIRPSAFSRRRCMFDLSA